MWNRWRLWLCSRRTRRIVTILLLCGVAYGYIRLRLGATQTSEINKAAIRRALQPESLVTIKIGMTKQEVIRLIGGPSGSYNQYPVVWRLEPDTWEALLSDRYKTETWTGDESELTICFDDKGIVQGAFDHPIHCDSRTLLQRIFDWVRSRLP